MNLGSGDSIASKPIAKRVIPIIVLRREPFLDEPPLSGEVLARPPQADLRRFVSLTENDHTPHMGRNPNMRDSSYERDGTTHYTTDRIVEEFGVLAAKAA